MTKIVFVLILQWYGDSIGGATALGEWSTLEACQKNAKSVIGQIVINDKIYKPYYWDCVSIIKE